MNPIGIMGSNIITFCFEFRLCIISVVQWDFLYLLEASAGEPTGHPADNRMPKAGEPQMKGIYAMTDFLRTGKFLMKTI